MFHKKHIPFLVGGAVAGVAAGAAVMAYLINVVIRFFSARICAKFEVLMYPLSIFELVLF